MLWKLPLDDDGAMSRTCRRGRTVPLGSLMTMRGVVRDVIVDGSTGVGWNLPPTVRPKVTVIASVLLSDESATEKTAGPSVGMLDTLPEGVGARRIANVPRP